MAKNNNKKDELKDNKNSTNTDPTVETENEIIPEENENPIISEENETHKEPIEDEKLNEENNDIEEDIDNEKIVNELTKNGLYKDLPFTIGKKDKIKIIDKSNDSEKSKEDSEKSKEEDPEKNKIEKEKSEKELTEYIKNIKIKTDENLNDLIEKCEELEPNSEQHKLFYKKLVEYKKFKTSSEFEKWFDEYMDNDYPIYILNKYSLYNQTITSIDQKLDINKLYYDVNKLKPIYEEYKKTQNRIANINMSKFMIETIAFILRDYYKKMDIYITEITLEKFSEMYSELMSKDFHLAISTINYIYEFNKIPEDFRTYIQLSF